MTIDSLRRRLTSALTDGRIDRAEARGLVDEVRGGGLDAAERAELRGVLSAHGSSFEASARADFAAALGGEGPPQRSTYAATRTPWTTTYWPMAGNGDETGSASSNLWAKNGPLDKLDQLSKARGRPGGARAFELRPALNWLVGRPQGHYIPKSMLSEADAERSTGVDFNGNGTIDPDVKWDFIDSRDHFGKDGKTDGSMSVGWWGSCDKVSRAGILFEEPKHDVTVDGVTFTPQDIKGLLTVIADSQGGGSDFVGDRYDAQPDVIALEDGTQLRGTILSAFDQGPGARRQDDWRITRERLPDALTVRLMDGTEKTFARAELDFVAREDRRDDPVVMHETIASWLSSGRAAVMDKDSGDHVWNYNFYKAEDAVYADGARPAWASDAMLSEGHRGPFGGGALTWVERTVTLGGGGGTVSYKYWLEEQNGKLVNGGWAPDSASPDFLWRPQTEATFEGHNERNPHVDPKLVKELYEASLR